MSRFFGTGSDSETESSEEEEISNVPRQQATAVGYAFSDEEEEAKRVVRSAREKRYEELKNTIRQIRNHKKNRDMNSMLSSFEVLVAAYQKALPVIQKEENGITPRFFVRCLVEMEECVAEVWEDRDGRKNMSKQNSKSLATLRQKLRRHNKENFEEDIAKFKENPDLPDEEEEEKEEDSDSSASEADEPSAYFRKKGDSEAKPTDAKAKFLKGAADEDDEEGSDDSIDWGRDSEDESSSDDDEGNYTSLREKFLKRTTDKEEEEKKKKDKKDKKEKSRKVRKDEEEKEGEWETVKGAPTSARPKLFPKDAEITLDAVIKKLSEILSGRGKKGTDRREQIELLTELQSLSDIHGLGVGMGIKIRFAIVASIYDYNPKITDAMKPAMWERLMQRLNDLIDVLLTTPDLTIGEHVIEESEVLDKAPYRIRGCVLTLIERMDEEFVKILKDCDAHSNEYVERLKDEKRVCELIDRVMNYVERQAMPSEVCRIYLRKVEHLYYKFDSRVIELRAKNDKLEKGDDKEAKVKAETVEEKEKVDAEKAEKEESEKKDGDASAEKTVQKDGETSLEVMSRLCHFIYTKDLTDRLRTRAILCHIYHHALHDNWYEARDLMLMSHLQDSIQHSDPPTQILYNRTMVQLGLCAFRHGNIKDAHNCLADIMMTGKVKELLAQGLLPQIRHKNERSIEQEKIERQRQIPFHMHINLELLECVYLVSAMLIEIPYMAAHEFDARRRLISKTFYQQLRSSERQPLVGPPESMREHIVAASRAMRNGNWRACVNYVINEKMNGKVWGLFYQPDKVKEMLKSKIQEEALRTYLFTYSHVYDCISMITMSEMFELEKAVVHSIISKMIINEELMASLDEPSQTVVMHRTEPTRLQSLALQLSDKVGTLVESNDRILELKQGAFFGRGMSSAFRDRQPFNRQGQDWGRNRRDNRGGNY